MNGKMKLAWADFGYSALLDIFSDCYKFGNWSNFNYYPEAAKTVTYNNGSFSACRCTLGPIIYKGRIDGDSYYTM